MDDVVGVLKLDEICCIEVKEWDSVSEGITEDLLFLDSLVLLELLTCVVKDWSEVKES